MKGHTRASLSMGVVTIHFKSIKKKLNVKSSTKSELVVVDGCMPQVLWKNYLIEIQIYEIDAAIIYQDNNSTILLEKNGTLSIIRRTNHINARYFLLPIKYQMDKCSCRTA